MGFYQEPDGSLSKTATPQSTWRGDIKDDMTMGGYQSPTQPSYTPIPISPYSVPANNGGYSSGFRKGSKAGTIIWMCLIGLGICCYVISNWTIIEARIYTERYVLLNQFFSRGAAILGIWLAVQYFACLIRGLPRMPWSIILGLAWLSFAGAFVMVLGVDPKVWISTELLHTNKHTELLSTYITNFSFGLCWLATIVFWLNRKQRV